MSARHLALALLAATLVACSRPAAPGASAAADPDRPLPSPVPEVVARVNGQPVHLRQVLPLAKAEMDALPEAERAARRAAVLRRSVDRYVDRELLVQEALARGVSADAREVEWAYDQVRREHAEDAAWRDFLARQGLDPLSLREELRAQQTVAALLRQEQAAAPGQDPAAVEGALLSRLRARARVELLL
jgi:hypothetical protein